MVLGIYLKLDQSVLYNSDYSSDSSLKFTGTVYSDKYLSSAFDLTGYTLTLRLYRENATSDRFNQACTITVAASGTFYINIAQSTLPTDGIYLAKMELSKSGTVVSTLNRVEIMIKRGPTV